MNIILKAILNFIKSIIGKIAYNRQMSALEDVQKNLEQDILDSKTKAKNLRKKLKEVPKDKNAKEASDFVKNFINKGRK